MRSEDANSAAVSDKRNKKEGGIAQLARASALQAEGRRFDSDYLHKEKTALHIVVELFFAFLNSLFYTPLLSKNI